jgi:hypothetical protein
VAQSLSIDGTPTFVFDDVIEPSFATFILMTRYVAAIRQNGGCKVLLNAVVNQRPLQIRPQEAHSPMR